MIYSTEGPHLKPRGLWFLSFFFFFLIIVTQQEPVISLNNLSLESVYLFRWHPLRVTSTVRLASGQLGLSSAATLASASWTAGRPSGKLWGQAHFLLQPSACSAQDTWPAPALCCSSSCRQGWEMSAEPSWKTSEWSQRRGLKDTFTLLQQNCNLCVFFHEHFEESYYCT